MVNVELLRKAVEWVEAQASLPFSEREWNQRNWVTTIVWCKDTKRYKSCGTAYCVAGYIGQLLEPAYANTEIYNHQHVSEFAREKLGLTVAQASRIFYRDNTAADIRLIAEDIAGERL